ncbi:MAG TPA: CopD family protein [Gemmatimonadales bacterium]|nr:CopD family protein [Gemmatimonadales bacterium]
MPALYYLSVTLHLLAAFFWLGGMLFLAAVGAPVLRQVEPAALRQRLFHQLGLRLRTPGWIAITTLLITGVVNLHYRGWLRWDGLLGEAAFWATPLGQALAVKLMTVTVMIATSAWHDFVLGPRAGLAEPGSAEALALRRKTALLGRVSAIVGLVLIVAAVRLARGG